MECTKCHKLVPKDAKICPHCKKVLALECPNCKSIQYSSVCDNCGFIILEKCAKCGKLVPTNRQKCKCGYPVKSSIAINESENDEFASLVIQFKSLKNIRNLLASHELYKKFYTRLNNLLISQLKDVDGKIIYYPEACVVNLNKELSLTTSSDKAVRLAIKILNTFTDLNAKIMQELGTTLKLTITIIRKTAEDLLLEKLVENDVRLLSIKKDEKKYLHGMQIIMDQFIQDCIAKNYKTDSLYSLEQDGNSVMYYEIITANYILPPNETKQEEPQVIAPKQINKVKNNISEDIYSFNVFDIKAKCKFEKIDAANLLKKISENKITSIKTNADFEPVTSELVNLFEKQGLKVIRAFCKEEMQFKPWGIFEQLFRDYYKLSEYSPLIPAEFNVDIFTEIKNLLYENPRKAASSEDARFAYMDDFSDFLASLKECVIIIENIDYIDDTTINVFELFFDKYSSLNSQFIFTSSYEYSLHGKIKSLLRTEDYIEYTLTDLKLDSLIGDIKSDATDFINSFYYEKISENYGGSKIYFDNAIRYLKNKGVLIEFENKLLIQNNTSVLLPADLKKLIKARVKFFAKDMDLSMALAYSNYFGQRIDLKLLEKLGLKDVESMSERIEQEGFGYVRDGVIYFNNYRILHDVIKSSLKPNVEEMLIKNIFLKLGDHLSTTSMLLHMGRLNLHKEQALMIWKNAQYSLTTGDFDAYLKNCLGFMSIIDKVSSTLSEEEIASCKMEIYQNILMSLYAYSPTKIYSIENILLVDAMEKNDDEQIVKLSNLMLQGALLSANYTDALSLLHNIYERMSDTDIIVSENINTKFLLLSLVNIQILFNIGRLSECINIANDILNVLRPDIIGKIKPASFSAASFIEHLLEIYRLVCFAKLLRGDDDIEDYFIKIYNAIGKHLPEESCIKAIRSFLQGKDFIPSKIEEDNAFSKLIYLILQEFSQHTNDYKSFAQNIYQAKLLAHDLHQSQIEMFCELLIAYSYANIDIKQKAQHIYNDLIEKADNSAIFNILVLAKYFLAKLKISENEIEDAFFIINDTLAILQENGNEAKLLYVLVEKLFIEVLEQTDNENIKNIDSEIEKNKLFSIQQNNEFARIIQV